MSHRRVQLFALLLCCLFLVQTGLAQNGAATPAPTSLNGLDGFIEEIMKEWKVPGLAVAVVKDGKIVHAKGYGLRDVSKGLKVTPDTHFAIGSCSKAFTATALALLVEEGKLEWDKPVIDYLPDFRLYDDYATTHLRVRDLVTHQSGLPRHDVVWYGSPLSRKEIFARLRYLEPSRPLHARFQYNNLMCHDCRSSDRTRQRQHMGRVHTPAHSRAAQHENEQFLSHRFAEVAGLFAAVPGAKRRSPADSVTGILMLSDPRAQSIRASTRWRSGSCCSWVKATLPANS